MAVLRFVISDVFAVCFELGEPVNIWIRELNSMYPQNYGEGTTLLTIKNAYASSIAEHLINNRNCTSSYRTDLFTILSKLHFHQKVLETIHIFTHKPSLCKQKECLLGLNLITIWFTPPFSKQLAFFSSTLCSPSPLSFLNRVLDSSVISEDLNRLVVKFYFLKLIKLVSFKYNKILYTL